MRINEYSWTITAALLVLASACNAQASQATEETTAEAEARQDHPVQFVTPVYPQKNEPAISALAAPDLYRFYRAGDSVVTYTTPNGVTIGLDVAQCAVDTWCCTFGSDGGREICYFNYSSNEDDIMEFSLKDAPSIRCTLLHQEDDTPRKLYFATDSGNNCGGGNSYGCFRLRSEGVTTAPVAAWATYWVACF